MADPVLAMSELHAWYGESHVLHGVDMTVEEGQVVTLLGRNGAGKSTTLKSIVGLVRKRHGSITLRGRELTTVAPHELARWGLGYVPEDRGIFASLSVEENLMLPPSQGRPVYSRDEIYALFPNLHERRKSSGGKLSGGEQQMLAIARVLCAGARILLLDEPTEGLAPVIVQRIGELIGGLKAQGITILLVEQNFEFARRLADKYYVMDGGRIVDAFGAESLQAKLAGLKEQLGV